VAVYVKHMVIFSMKTGLLIPYKNVGYKLRLLNFIAFGSILTIASGFLIHSDDMIGRWWGWPFPFLSSPLDALGILFHPNTFFLTFLVWGVIGYILPVLQINTTRALNMEKSQENNAADGE